MLEKMKALETENGELRDINDKLVKELENKDQAIKEAVTIICNLEEKIVRMGLAMRDTKPATASSATIHSTASRHPSSSPEEPLQPTTSKKRASTRRTKPEGPLTNTPTNRHINAATPTPPKTPRRTPSFHPTTRGSASAIRSIYQHENMSSIDLSALSLPRPGSLHSLATTTNTANPFDDGISSPRLSILSESSFVSVYGRPPQHTHEAEEKDAEDVWFGKPEPTTKTTTTTTPGAPPTPTKTLLPPTPDTLTPLASAAPSERIRVVSPSPAPAPAPASPSPSASPSSLRASPSSSGSDGPPTFMGGAALTGPQTSYGTDMMFNGDGGLPRRPSLVSRVFRRRSVDESSAGSGGSGGSSGASRLGGLGRRVSAKIRGGLRGRKGGK